MSLIKQALDRAEAERRKQSENSQDSPTISTDQTAGKQQELSLTNLFWIIIILILAAVVGALIVLLLIIFL